MPQDLQLIPLLQVDLTPEIANIEKDFHNPRHQKNENH